MEGRFLSVLASDSIKSRETKKTELPMGDVLFVQSPLFRSLVCAQLDTASATTSKIYFPLFGSGWNW